MKSKSLGISLITLILGIICGLGFVSMPKQQIEASAAETTYTQYMLEGGVPVKKEGLTTSAGKMYVNNQIITSNDDLFFVLTEMEKIDILKSERSGYNGKKK